MIVVDPRRLTAQEWCDYTADNLSAIMPPMKVADDDDWQRFGAYVISNFKGQAVQVPDPYGFSSFEEWAVRFNQAIASVELT